MTDGGPPGGVAAPEPALPAGGVAARLRRIWHSSTQRVMSLSLLGMVLGVLVDVLIAAKLGTTQSADALIIALSLPVLIDTVLREGTGSGLVPLFMARRRELTADAFGRYMSAVVNFALTLGGGMVLLMELTAPLLVRLLAPGLAPGAREEATLLLRVCAPMALFAPGTTVLSVLLNSQQRFEVVALRRVFVPAIVIGGTLVAGGFSRLAVGIAAAYSAGSAVCFWLLFRIGREVGGPHDWSARIERADRARLREQTLLPTLGFNLRQGMRLVDRMFASLTPIGGVATYYFAFRILSAAQSLIGMSIATTAQPKLVQRLQDGGMTRLRRATRRAVLHALAFSLPLAGVLFFFSHAVVTLVYRRGAFTADAASLSAHVLRWFAVGLPFFCATPVLQSALYTLGRIRQVFSNTLLVVAVNLAGVLALWPGQGIAGLAMGLSLSGLVSFASLSYMLTRIHDGE